MDRRDRGSRGPAFSGIGEDVAVATTSLRAQRSNPESFRGGTLECFAALAMTRLEVVSCLTLSVATC
ncbi:hypothetical protein EAV90_07010 [Bradyrhizobium vignae]|nr:hypothetical protein EAV90_07010 [Bradyrhizobium vignae]